jgi:RNA polymerase sigma-70 factor (ECF subfamily)
MNLTLRSALAVGRALGYEFLAITDGKEIFSTLNRLDPMSHGASVSDVDLLRRMGEGDSGALGEFYDRHSGLLFGLICRILRDVKEAEDVLQDVLLQIWDKAALFDPLQGRPLAWALALARHKAIDRLRAAQRRRARFVEETESEAVQDLPAALPSPPEDVRALEEGEVMRSALGILPTEQRRAIELAFYDGLTQTEIAAALNQPLGTVKARIRRGMLKLRTELEQRL